MRTIAITSGKGGVGKTSLSANIGIALAELGQKVVLFDADLSLANLDIILGTSPEFTLQNVLAEEKTLDEIVAKGPGGIEMIAGGSGISSLMHSGPKKLGKFMEQLTVLERKTNYLFFDTGAGLDNKVMTFLKAADDVVLVATPDPASITDSYATAKVLLKRKPAAKIYVLVNQAMSEKQGQAIYEHLNTVTKNFLGKSLSFAGVVRHDQDVLQGVRTRKPILISSPNCMAAKDIRKIAKSLHERCQSETKASLNLANRLLEEVTESQPDQLAS